MTSNSPILFCGQMRNGKDSLIKAICKVKPEYEKSHKVVGFADPVKEIICSLLGITLEQLEEKKKSLEPLGYGGQGTMRDLLQFIGDGPRKFYPNIWIDKLYESVGCRPVFIRDGRYLNELLANKEREGINILVWRPTYENNVDHPSENQLSGIRHNLIERNEFGKVSHPLIDLFIMNKGTEEELVDTARNVIIPFIENNGW